MTISRDIWKTIEIGTHENIWALMGDTEKEGHKIIREVLLGPSLGGDLSMSKEKTTIELAKISVANLGYPDGATTEEILTRALENCLFPCPAEASFQLRRQYGDQPEAEYLYIATNPHWNQIFYVYNAYSELWMRRSFCFSNEKWSPESLWVLALQDTRHLYKPS